jgi:hypothetical protein
MPDIGVPPITPRFACLGLCPRHVGRCLAVAAPRRSLLTYLLTLATCPERACVCAAEPPCDSDWFKAFNASVKLGNRVQRQCVNEWCVRSGDTSRQMTSAPSWVGGG